LSVTDDDFDESDADESDADESGEPRQRDPDSSDHRTRGLVSESLRERETIVSLGSVETLGDY
jgi:hypothetical protein